MEQWKAIQGYEGRYEVSNLGRVRSLDLVLSNGHFYRGQIISPRKNNGGYMLVNLSRSNKVRTFSLHRLVANAFIANVSNCKQVNHINEDKTDNRAVNLEWCSASYNTRYGHRNDTMINQRKKAVCQFTMDGNLVNNFPILSLAARETGINAAHICDVCKGKRKSAGGYVWKYA